MNLITLVSGFVTAFVGITPPGLIMTAAKVNLKEGKKKCLLVVLSGNYHFLPGSYCNTLYNL
jgi:hypothetical protein